jgi:hypothetical protein
VKQRSDKWLEIRKSATVTGSTLFQALGLDALKKQREYCDDSVCGQDKKKVSEDVQKMMNYGTENENNATRGSSLPNFMSILVKLC